MARPTALILGAAVCQFCLVFTLKLHQESPCRCTLENGTVIDLERISTVGEPSFKYAKPSAVNDTATYSYNPCNPFTLGPLGSGCNDVALCQNTSTGGYYSLGQLSSAKFVFNESTNTIVIMYHGDSPRVANVSLRCSPQHVYPEFKVIGETETTKYQMVLLSECACPNGCVERAPADSGLSTGTILIILVLVFFLTYLLGGMIFMRLVQGATGLETIPNHDFWFGLPSLIRDGIVFAMSGCKVEETYDRI